MPQDKFRLPQSSYEELVKIIKGYGHMRQPSVPSEVSTIAGVHPTIVSRNNAFLVSTDIVEGTKTRVLTSKGRALSDALEHELEEQIRTNWRVIVSENDFFHKVVSAVKVRKGMDRPTLQSHIAYSAGEKRSGLTMAGANAVVDILTIAGYLEQQGDKLLAVSTANEVDKEFTETIEPHVFKSITPIGEKRLSLSQSSVRVPQTQTLVSFQIQIQCSPADVEGLAPKLRALLKEISEFSASEKPKSD